MSTIRHWRQRWDPKADLVLLRPLTFEGRPMRRGEVIPPEMRAKLGLRLKNWWESGRVALAGGPGSPSLPAEVAAAAAPVVEAALAVEVPPVAEAAFPSAPAPEPAPARPRASKAKKAPAAGA